MSIGHRLDEDELQDVTLAELYATLGTQDTPRLFAQPYAIDTAHDIPFGAGNSIDRKTKYIDRLLYQEAMDNGFAATGLDPQQIIDRWLDHEHSEKSIADGDNPIELYFGCHRCGLAKEHEGVLAVLGHANAELKIRNYEAVIWPGLVRCYDRTVKKPPLDLWCAPLLDEPDDRDEAILKVMTRMGVIDAGKRSKYSTHYGISGRPCRTCKNWHPDVVSQEQGQLATCRIVSGLARDTRHCDFFVKVTNDR